MPLPLFVFGTLRHDPLRAAVAGAPLPGRRAQLPDHAVARALDGQGRPQPFPLLAPRPGALAEGLLLEPDADQRARLDLYEQLFRYHPHPVEVLAGGVPVRAVVYLPETDSYQPGPDWDLDRWATDWGALRTGAAAEVMALSPGHDAATMARRYPMIELATASRLRAEAEQAPATQRRAPVPADVASMSTRRPYAGFFGVQEDDLRVRRFDGGFGAVHTWAGLVSGDAVSVLPWDPETDLVMLVEQFRYGAWLRGDPNPWSLEAIAGRIDPAETPEDAARREAEEEAGLKLGALHRVAGCYTSPGATTEYLYSYVALATLSAGDAGLGGAAGEAEDIRAHVIPFSRLMALIASGEVANAPLLITALWLDSRREMFRAAFAP